MVYPFQESLPKLPLPNLDNICESYLQMVAPLVNEADFIRTKNLVRNFQQSLGPILQQQLETLEFSTETSYIYEFQKNIFLESRLSLVHQNFGCVLNLDSTSNEVPFARFVARWIITLLRFYLKIKRGDFDTHDEVIKKPFGVYQYLNFFGRTRVPRKKCDTLQQALAPKHIVIIRHNVFYSLTLLNGEELLNIAEIAQQIEWILKHTPTGGTALGALTTLDREHWAKLRLQLVAYDSKNSDSLKILDNALFVVCLDETIPTNIEATMKNVVYGNGRNRWFDKTLQLIFTPNNQLALNIEHSELDGYPTLRFFADANRYYQQLDDETVVPSNSAIVNPLIPLQWNLPENILQTLQLAVKNVEHLVAQHEMQVFEFKEFGRTFIAKQQLHADALVQFSLQLTYFRLYGKIASVWESIYMGHFRYGRGKGISPVTTEFLQLIKALTDEKLPYSKPWQILKQANDSHVSQLASAMNGVGCDRRHLFVLNSLAQQHGVIPDMFCDKVYTEIFCKSILSTTSLPNLPLDFLVSFHPEVTHGYGIFYRIKPDRIIFTLNSKHQPIDQFIEMLRLSLIELVNLKSYR